MELSTNIPIPSARPDSEIMFNVIFVKYISTTAKTTLSGMEHAITSVGFISFKNNNNTIIARMAPTIMFSTTDFTIMSM